MIEGAKAYFAKNIRVPQAVRDATSGYFVDKDSVQSFLAEETVKDQRAKVAKGDLHATYLRYCEAELVDPVGKREFGTIIKKLGYEGTSDGRIRYWQGVTSRA